MSHVCCRVSFASLGLGLAQTRWHRPASLQQRLLTSLSTHILPGKKRSSTADLNPLTVNVGGHAKLWQTIAQVISLPHMVKREQLLNSLSRCHQQLNYKFFCEQTKSGFCLTSLHIVVQCRRAHQRPGECRDQDVSHVLDIYGKCLKTESWCVTAERQTRTRFRSTIWTYDWWNQSETLGHPVSGETTSHVTRSGSCDELGKQQTTSCSSLLSWCLQPDTNVESTEELILYFILNSTACRPAPDPN